MSEAEAVDRFKKHQRLFTTLAIVTVVVILLLSLLPFAIRMGAISWLEDHGVQQAEIDNVDLNLFAGTFVIEGLSADEGLKVGRLALNVDWWPLTEHHLFLRSVELKYVKAEVHQREDGSWQVATIELDEPAPEIAPKPENEKDATEPWQVVLNAIEVADINLKVTGAIDKQNFDLSLPLDSLKLSLASAEAGGAQLLNHSLELGKVTFSGLGYEVESGSLNLDNTIHLPAMGSDIAAGLKFDNLNLKLNGLRLHDSRHDVRLAAVDTVVLEKASIAGGKSALFDLLSIQGIALPTAGKDSLGRIGKIDISGGDLNFAGDYRLEKIAVHDLQASLKKLKNGKMLVLDRLQANSGTKTASKPKEKSEEAKPESTDIAVKESKGAPESEGSKQPVVYIDEFLISKGSVFAFRDESLFPPFDTKVQVETFSFAPIDPSGKDVGKLNVLLKLNKNGSLSIQGDLSPKADDLRSDLKVVLKNFDMPGLTGYVETDFGQSIQTGQLNLDSNIKIADNKIDAANKLLIRKLTLKKAKQPGKAESSIGMPVDMALDMVRDDRGDISMDVPITGRLDDPDINVNDVISSALFSSMSAGAMTYAKLILQPYGAIYMAAEFALDAAQDAAKPKLTPVQFGERSVTLSPEMNDYAEKIALLMKSKEFRLEICGVATRIEGEVVPQPSTESAEADPNALPPQPMSDEELLQLAEARSDAVMKVIQEQGIAADRLFNCRPAIDEEPEKVLPRVELILD
ncbi:MAG: DUF748 domain-containing protein [Mariprofundaceae bacterium]